METTPVVRTSHVPRKTVGCLQVAVLVLGLACSKHPAPSSPANRPVPPGCEVGALSTSSVTPAILAATVSARWQYLADQLSPELKFSSDPVAQMLAAHAMLATNQVDPAALAFEQMRTPDGLAVWGRWTARFRACHPESAVAQYLDGDSRARFRQWDAASAAFATALEKDSGFALARNARVIVALEHGDIEQVRNDIPILVRTNPPLAEALVTSGRFALRENKPAEAENHFARAMEVSHGSAIANSGLGAAALRQGHLDRATEAFESAAGRLDLPVVRNNFKVAVDAVADVTSMVEYYYQTTDFSDWASCRGSLQGPRGTLARDLAGVEIDPGAPTRPVTDRLNALVDRPAFAEEHFGALGRILRAEGPSGGALQRLLDKTQPLRSKRPSELTAIELAAVREVNRAALDVLLPCGAADPNQAPGMTLAMRNGRPQFVNAWEYTKSLPTDKLTRARDRVEMMKPIADAFQNTPGLRGWSQHLAQRDGQLNDALKLRGIDSRSGGVDTSKMALAFLVSHYRPHDLSTLGYAASPTGAFTGIGR